MIAIALATASLAVAGHALSEAAVRGPRNKVIFAGLAEEIGMLAHMPVDQAGLQSFKLAA